MRERLHVHATGHIHGEIKYKNLEIDSGGRIGGTLMELSPEEAETAHHTAGVGNGAAGSPAGGAAPGGAASGDATSSGPSGDGAGTATGNAGSYANGAGAPAGGGF